MLNEFIKIKYYVVAVIVALGLFVWAGLSGTRLLGDDKEKTDSKNSYYGSSGRSGGHGYSRFYHK
ncbi:hypothetical protein [Spirosoma sp. KNUC1025]|uniref:hypothetical protein n=1 Tax=Spirosoma sp. KNUC1025 TaxID=2894082 RepID=UPI003865A66F|nr:hypothetical protein LN737_12270 [Spirosoma sp. KNUC1025]